MAITRTAWTDDDGSGTTGTVLNNAVKTELYDQIDAATAAIATSGQVIFPAVQVPSAVANTLDDYEEGTWTPVIVSSGGGAPTYSNQNGFYVKVGKLVHVQAYVHLATIGTLAAGTVTITGLPFALGAATGEYSVFNMPYWGSFTSTLVHLGGFAAPGASLITVVLRATAGTGIASATVADLSGTAEIILQGQYRAAN